MPVSNNFRPELLAPAGSEESVLAAVRCGADAVYLGAKAFSARSSAQNFDDAQLAEAVRYCHIHGVQVHQAVNTLVFDSELERAEQCIKTAVACGVDALIVQDLGVAQLAYEICPQMPLHGSTQMTVHTADGVRLLKELGFTRAVLSRELSLAEIKKIRESTDLELEVFVHGALCMSMSGQCYFSAMLGSRSGNRGMCAQPCRLPFSANSDAANVLSLKDLCSAQMIDELTAAGIDSFKIEGRMKRPEYVAAAVSAYRKAIDENITETDKLRAVFSRSGFTNGYLEDKRGAEMFGIRKKEDVTAAAGVLKSLKNTYDKEVQRVPLDITFELKENQPMKLTASDGVYTVSAEGDCPERALKVALSEQKIRDSAEKWGGTPYFARSVDIDADKNMTTAVSKINKLRRECAEQLSEKRAEITMREMFNPRLKRHVAMSGNRRLWGRFPDYNAVSDYARENLAKIVVPIESLLSADIKKTEKLVAQLPRALFAGEEKLFDQLKQLKDKGVTQVVAGNIASVYTAQKAGLEVHGGFSLNIANSRSVNVLKQLGVKSAVCSAELTLDQLKNISAEIPLGAFAYGRLPLMLTRNCPVKSQKTCAECKGGSSLRDRKNIEFPVACSGVYTEILNSQPTYMADRLRELPLLDYLYLHFTAERNTDEIIRAYLSGERPEQGKYTRGLFYRGV